jgi:CheY-like chemotaxis protein
MSAQLKVLCVDDNAAAAGAVAQLLADAGCDVQVCHGGPEALALAEGFRPDVCVIDLSMPGMDGDELAVRLQERAGPVRCIALTGHWDITSQHRTSNAGFAEHLVKPVEPERLVQAVTGRAPAPA